MQQVQIISYRQGNSKIYKITVKIKETKGTSCITVGWDKLRILKWLAEIL